MNARIRIATATAALLLAAACSGRDDEPDRATPSPVGDHAQLNADGVELIEPGGPGQPRGPLPDPKTVDETDAGEVADAAAVAAFVVDTRTDHSPADGLRRAAPWLTTDYARAVAQPMPGDGGADWIELAAADGYTSVTVTPSDEVEGGKSTGSQVVLTRVATVQRHDAQGKQLSTEQLGVFITLTRTNTGAPWRVEAITTA
ncbi:hypothetical protein [Aeromicrobium sp. IC_218]|uniref:hypothetical protein n=1 Tax=Aeromicrobium sp. IC_218 TaxID=2545468 RepID=UPI00103B8F19|nr:hypothetical protein [Aeromicrobium sp. IC_218]TCI96370.1 hypothetical protein E0W78_14650 [Aeromicrobium sp. IC_218]